MVIGVTLLVYALEITLPFKQSHLNNIGRFEVDSSGNESPVRCGTPGLAPWQAAVSNRYQEVPVPESEDQVWWIRTTHMHTKFPPFGPLAAYARMARG